MPPFQPMPATGGFAGDSDDTDNGRATKRKRLDSVRPSMGEKVSQAGHDSTQNLHINRDLWIQVGHMISEVTL